jgi:hypothetical protein
LCFGEEKQQCESYSEEMSDTGEENEEKRVTEKNSKKDV